MDYITTKDVKFRFNGMLFKFTFSLVMNFLTDFSGMVDKSSTRRSTPSPASLSQKVWNVSQLEKYVFAISFLV